MLIGEGKTDGFLDSHRIRSIVEEAVEALDPDGKRCLFIIPDHTRTAPMDLLFPLIYEALADRVQRLDFLIALGTHPPMSEAAIAARIGISHEGRLLRYPKARFFNHRWDDPQALIPIGTLSASEVAELSGGLMAESVRVTVNRMIPAYDRLVIVGPVFPHEVVGFSGGNKYLFPGVAGAEIIDMFHWLGALITSFAIIGRADTPVRRVIDRATSFLPVAPFCLAMVVHHGGLAGLFAGPSEEAWREAVRLSERLHILYYPKPFRRVLSCAPPMYDDLWTGAKCMYKLEPVVADGGELIIYAPHITEISITHGAKIREIGYHVRDYFLKQWDRFKDVPGGIRAHSTHLKGLGTYEGGVEKPRIQVTLATGIPREVCEAVSLGYRDPASIRIEEWIDREDEGILYVPKAGEMLYRLRESDTIQSDRG